MSMNAKHLFGDLTNQQFLDEYWEQKPLLIRQAFPDIKPPFSAEELAGLCCDTDAPARLVIEKKIEHGVASGKENQQKPWQVINAPLETEHFLTLPDTHWTLLVNDLERYYPEHLALLAHFNFIPDWRKDDLMVSYAVEGGSVGPHIDEYGVFLIQALGERHWQLDPSADSNHLIPDIELKLLAEFNARQEWTLSPGDMLYLPPRLAHYGVAQNDCMTYSVGLRAPSQQELIESFLDTLYTEGKTTHRYNDSARAIQVQFGEIEAGDIKQLKRFLLSAFEDNDDLFTNWLGQYLTEKKNAQLEEYMIDDLFTDKDFIDKGFVATKDVQKNHMASYFRAPSSEIAWINHADHITIFINGEASNWPVDIKNSIQLICKSYQYSETDIQKELNNSNFRKLFDVLLKKKIVYGSKMLFPSQLR